MKILKTQGRDAKGARDVLAKLERRQQFLSPRVAKTVKGIMRDVRKSGDRALLKYRQKLDGISPQQHLLISRDEMKQAWKTTPPALQQALETAAGNIRQFAEKQLPEEWTISPIPGLTTGQLVRPLGSVGCYVPSGRYPLPSTLLMTVIPGQVARVERIVVASPKPARETLAAAFLLGVREFYRIGGAQAIAALAYGTETISRVDKIVGPGNLYVTTAKRLVAFDCTIDMLAGPTEIVVASDHGDPEMIAADLVAQAEHDPETLAIFVTTNANLARQVSREVKARSRKNTIAKDALSASGFIFLAADANEAHEITNRIAPEHLTVDDEADLTWVQNAGTVFVGNDSAQPMGDYLSGPNHTLPTGGLAKTRGGLSVTDYLKVITVQRYDHDALKQFGPAAIALAEAEGLHGHAEAVRARGVQA